MQIWTICYRIKNKKNRPIPGSKMKKYHLPDKSSVFSSEIKVIDLALNVARQ